MPANIEVKARLIDAEEARRKARQLSGGPPDEIHQIDVFFNCPEGRLKLRIFDSGSGELIGYHRTDDAEIRRSDYHIVRTPDAMTLLEILRQSLGESGMVEKMRHLYEVDQTRIHIDHVEGLGDFLEVEVVLRPGQSEDEGYDIAQRILKEMGILPDQYVAAAYVDLLKG